MSYGSVHRRFSMIPREGNLIWEFIFFVLSIFFFPSSPGGFCGSPGGSWWLLRLLVAPGGSWWLLVAPGGSWWLLVASMAPGS